MIYEPMLGRPADEHDVARLIHDDVWALDVKADGDRKLLVVEDHTLAVFGRDGQRTNLPRDLAATMAALDGRWVFDAELLGGRTLVLFDLVSAGRITTATPWVERRDALNGIHAAWAPGPAIRLVPSAEGVDAKIDLVERVIAGRGEGVMGKRMDAPYEPGRRSHSWLKVKRSHEVDCVVDWLGTEKDNAGLVVYKGRKKIPVGEVGRGSGDGARMKVGDVVAVKVTYTTDDGKLYSPTKPRIRKDKRKLECTWDQIEAAATDKNLILNWKS